MRRFLWEHFVETTHHTLCFYNSVIITRTLLTSKQHGVPNNHGRRSECPNKCFIGSTNKSSSRDCGKTASQCGQNFKFLQARASQLFLQHLYLKKREVHSLNPSNLISCIGSAEKWSGKHVFLFRLICKTVNNGDNTTQCTLKNSRWQIYWAWRIIFARVSSIVTIEWSVAAPLPPVLLCISCSVQGLSKLCEIIWVLQHAADINVNMDNIILHTAARSTAAGGTNWQQFAWVQEIARPLVPPWIWSPRTPAPL